MTDTTGHPLHDLTAFQRDLLVAVDALGPSKGLAVKEYLDADRPDSINHSRLYTNLDTLAEKGLLQKTARDARTNEHTLTRRGRRELAAHRRWVGGAEAEA